jgi:polyisoprenoid-binding protein YceI
VSVTAEPITGTFVADRAHSTFRFTVKHMKVSSFSATFDDVTARVVTGPDGIQLEGSAKIESISIRTPKEFREHVVYSDDFFDANNHPEMTFRSSDVALNPDGTATVRGELTIKGITKSFVATGTYEPPVEDPWGTTRAAVELTASVDRRDWGLDWQMPMPKGGNVVSWDVTITTHVEFLKEG